MKNLFKTSLFSGLAFGIGVLAIIGGYLLVQAVAPGAVTNPAFGPNDDDVILQFTPTNYSQGCDDNTQSANIGAHTFCASAGFGGPGSFNDSCRTYKSGNNWFIECTNGGGAGSLACYSLCFD